MDRGAWGTIVHGVAKESDMTQQLNNNKLFILFIDFSHLSYSFEILTPSHSFQNAQILFSLQSFSKSKSNFHHRMAPMSIFICFECLLSAVDLPFLKIVQFLKASSPNSVLDTISFGPFNDQSPVTLKFQFIHVCWIIPKCVLTYSFFYFHVQKTFPVSIQSAVTVPFLCFSIISSRELAMPGLFWSSLLILA